jgi:superfamily II RNA helicase
VGWGELQNALAVLREAGATQAGDGDDSHQLTHLGEACSCVRGQNELWIGSVLFSGQLDSLSAPVLAGVITALLSDECISRPSAGAYSSPSEEAAAVLRQLLPFAERLAELQVSLQFDAPIGLSPAFVGLVESWTAGTPWAQICSDTTLDEGDVARLLRRVGEFLGGIGDVPNVSQSLRTAAREARRLVDRPPISELVAK